MNHATGEQGYGLWGLVIVNSVVFVLFALSFFKPRTAREWRTFGGFSAFIVALFVEMYGFPFTIYLLSGWLAPRVRGIALFSHDAGHLWYTLLGFKGDPHLNPIHIASMAFILVGFIVVAAAWQVLYEAQRAGELATSGPYAHIRHPQYAGFILVMLGFLLQWPTILTLAMFPILVVAYVRLARREEEEMAREFGQAWSDYASGTPGWFPSRRAPYRRTHAT